MYNMLYVSRMDMLATIDRFTSFDIERANGRFFAFKSIVNIMIMTSP